MKLYGVALYALFNLSYGILAGVLMAQPDAHADRTDMFFQGAVILAVGFILFSVVTLATLDHMGAMEK